MNIHIRRLFGYFGIIFGIMFLFIMIAVFIAGSTVGGVCFLLLGGLLLASGLIQENKIKKEIKEGAKYNEDCMSLKYPEIPENVSWKEPEFKKLLALLNTGDYEKACNEAEMLSSKYKHFGILYSWWGTALLEMGKPCEARQMMMNNLEKANEKYPIYSTLAEAALALKNLREMVYWISQAIHVQETLSDRKYGGVHDTYLYLSYLVRGYTEDSKQVGFDFSDTLRKRVDAINNGARLSPKAASELVGFREKNIDEPVKGVFRDLKYRYFVDL